MPIAPLSLVSPRRCSWPPTFMPSTKHGRHAHPRRHVDGESGRGRRRTGGHPGQRIGRPGPDPRRPGQQRRRRAGRRAAPLGTRLPRRRRQPRRPGPAAAGCRTRLGRLARKRRGDPGGHPAVAAFQPGHRRSVRGGPGARRHRRRSPLDCASQCHGLPQAGARRAERPRQRQRANPWLRRARRSHADFSRPQARPSHRRRAGLRRRTASRHARHRSGGATRHHGQRADATGSPPSPARTRPQQPQGPVRPRRHHRRRRRHGGRQPDCRARRAAGRRGKRHAGRAGHAHRRRLRRAAADVCSAGKTGGDETGWTGDRPRTGTAPARPRAGGGGPGRGLPAGAGCRRAEPAGRRSRTGQTGCPPHPSHPAHPPPRRSRAPARAEWRRTFRRTASSRPAH